MKKWWKHTSFVLMLNSCQVTLSKPKVVGPSWLTINSSIVITNLRSQVGLGCHPAVSSKKGRSQFQTKISLNNLLKILKKAYILCICWDMLGLDASDWSETYKYQENVHLPGWILPLMSGDSEGFSSKIAALKVGPPLSAKGTLLGSGQTK